MEKSSGNHTILLLCHLLPILFWMVVGDEEQLLLLLLPLTVSIVLVIADVRTEISLGKYIDIRS